MRFLPTFLTPTVTLLLLVSLSVPTAAQQKKQLGSTWYVSGKGNDTSDGKSEKSAFRTLKKSATVAKAGDFVLIGNGIYTDPHRGDDSGVLPINVSGTADAWITWKALPGTKPEIHPRGWNGIRIAGSYHIIEGLTIIGANDSLTLIRALEDGKKEVPNPLFNSNGISVNGRIKDAASKPHHIIIRNCTIAKCPGGGVSAIEADYVTVEDCIIYNNAWYMRYGGSGISTLNNWAWDDKPGYHIIIQRNKVWNNKTLVPWSKIGKLSDGNGIILDVTDLTKGPTNPNGDPLLTPETTTPVLTRPEWKGRALIASNISAFNGGSGIHTFRTKHVDIINNTTYWNGQVVAYQELFPNVSEDVVILNNVIVPKPGGQVTSNNKNKDIVWDYNLYTLDQDIFKGEHDIVSDPIFVSIEETFLQSDYRLKKQSKGFQTGTTELPHWIKSLSPELSKSKSLNRGVLLP